MATLLTLLMAGLVSAEVAPGGMLYPRESETREVRCLDGIWNFRLSDSLQGYTEHWQAQDLSKVSSVLFAENWLLSSNFVLQEGSSDKVAFDTIHLANYNVDE